MNIRSMVLSFALFFSLAACTSETASPPDPPQQTALVSAQGDTCGVLSGACPAGTAAECDHTSGQWQCVADKGCGAQFEDCATGTTAQCDHATGRWQCVADTECGVLSGACPVGTSAQCDHSAGQWRCVP
jgi:hypothetical protein